MIVRLGEREIGEGRPALLVAELGLNHGGSVDTALEMVRAASEAGADACKVQAFRARSFVTARATYQGEQQNDLFERHELSASHLSAISDECRRRDVIFFGTPDSIEQATLLVALGAPCLKVGSDDLIHIPLLRELARLGLPMILSTGMADFLEIDDAVTATATVPTVLLHCVSRYPTPPAEANLLRMKRLTGFHRLVGYSDHTDGIEAAVGAAWLGACMVEKHFTLDRTSAGPDHAFSADPVQWRALCQQVRSAERLRGNGHITDEQSEMRVLARRSVVAARALVPGEIITDDALAYKRPGDGLPPAARDRLVGRTVTRRLASDEQFREGDWA